MNDIIERLRNRNNPENRWVMMTEAAAEIERLSADRDLWKSRTKEGSLIVEANVAEVERLRVALEEIEHTTRHEIRRWDIANEIARRALEPKP